MKTKMIVEPRYEAQQAALNEIAAKLGVVAYRPEYHGEKRNCNTVLFYTPEAEAHNRKVDRESIHYTRGEAVDLKKQGVDVPQRYVYRDHFWAFENTDWNGAENLDYANRGKIDLRRAGWEKVLEGHIRLSLARKLQNEHIAATGGVWALREADEYYNDLNRERIEAFRMMHGVAFLGDINIHDHEKYERVKAGSDEGIYTEYTGQLVYNFGCDFCVPAEDEELAGLIRQWNRSEQLPKRMVDVELITGKIEAIGGIQFIWY